MLNKPNINELMQCVDSKYALVILAAKRARTMIERNPDYIVTITMYFGEGPTPVEEIMGRTGWENVTAVKNGAILNLVNNELSRPTPRLKDGAILLNNFVVEHERALAPAA